MEMVFYCVDCGKFFFGASDKEHSCRHCGSSKTAITQMSERCYADMFELDKTDFKRQIRAAYAPENMKDQSELYCKKCGKFVGLHTELCLDCQRVEKALRERIVRIEMVFYCVDCGKFFYGASDEEHTCPHCGNSKTVNTQMPKQRYSGLYDEAKATFKQKIRATYTPESMKDQSQMCCKKCGKFIGINAELCIDCQRQEITAEASIVQPPVEIKLGRAVGAGIVTVCSFFCMMIAITLFGLILGTVLAATGLTLGILSIVHFSKTSSVRSGERTTVLIVGIVSAVFSSYILIGYLVIWAAVASML